jgi:hypothetical protein
MTDTAGREPVGGAICDGGDKFEVRTIGVCPVEKKRRRIYGYFQHWYGWQWYCLGCGDRWADGELGSRPFARGWRAEAVTRHKASWDRAPRGSWRQRKPAFLAFVHAYFDENVA